MDKLDIILLMSVNPGFGGQKFIPNVLEKAKEARKMIDASGYDIRLEIDGCVCVCVYRMCSPTFNPSTSLDYCKVCVCVCL